MFLNVHYENTHKMYKCQFIFYLQGNKTDREDREIPRHIGEDFAQRHGMYFLETSAKEAENVERLFMEIAVELMEVTR